MGEEDGGGGGDEADKRRVSYVTSTSPFHLGP